MIIADRLKKVIKKNGASVDSLAGELTRSGLTKKQAMSAIRNWQSGLMKPQPQKTDMEKLAKALGVEQGKIRGWQCIYRHAPSAPRKARLVTELIAGRDVQEALDILKFTHKRAASMIEKVLKSAIASADEHEADVDNLYISEARVDGAGVRLGTKRWIAKDRGRAHSLRKECSHIVITVAERN